MPDYYPLLFVGGVIGAFSIAFIIAFASIKDKKEAIGFERNVKDSVIIKKLLSYAKGYLPQFIAVFFIMLFSIAYDIISPFLIGEIEEIVSKPGFSLSKLEWYVILYASILIVSVCSTYIQAIILQRTGQKIVSEVREDVFTTIESLSHPQFSKIPVGTMLTRAVYDTNSISTFFTGIAVNLFKNFFIMAGVLVAMLVVCPTFTLVVLCFVPFVILFTVIFRQFSRRASRRMKDATTDINIFLSENLSGIKITQIFNREGKKLEEFRHYNKKLTKAKMDRIFVFSIFRPMVYMLYMSSVLVLFYVAGKMKIDGKLFLGSVLTASTVVSFYLYLKKFFNPIQTLAEQFHRLQAIFSSCEKIFTVLEYKPRIVDAPDAVELENVRGEIEFKHVSFEYVKGEPVLNDVSFHIYPGQTVALVGATGAGKSTILSLICRNYEIEKGQILIDGIDIKKIKISSLRRHFGQMLQDVFIFSGTIRSNITLREESFTDDEINTACKYVNADALVSTLKNGLDEEVRERGNNFSAGERQLLSFARTIIHKPSVMILDEATANIDTETELLIQDSLEKIKSIGTMIIVAHRLSTIRGADRIYLMSHGRIIEEGTHEELFNKGGDYHRLYMLQSDIQSMTK